MYKVKNTAAAVVVAATIMLIPAQVAAGTSVKQRLMMAGGVAAVAAAGALAYYYRADIGTFSASSFDSMKESFSKSGDALLKVGKQGAQSVSSGAITLYNQSKGVLSTGTAQLNKLAKPIYKPAGKVLGKGAEKLSQGFDASKAFVRGFFPAAKTTVVKVVPQA